MHLPDVPMADFVSDYPSLVGGLFALAIALVAWIGDRRRLGRRDPDRVGIMPWSGLFFWALLLGSVMLAAAAQQWLGQR